MIPRVTLGRTGLEVGRLALGGYPFGGVNRARGWDPFTAEGRSAAIATVRSAVEAGINYVDTAPAYGNGNSESIIGEGLQGLGDRVYVASKVGYRGLGPREVTASVQDSLRRLRRDAVDVIQFHGGMYEAGDVRHILDEGLLDALKALREKGLVRWLGFTVEEPWTARPLIASGQFDVMQVRYNIIYQSAALHVLDEARRAGLGVAVMRPMTSGILQRIAHHLAPRWSEEEICRVALEFVLSDSRVHVANVGMRWPREVAANAALAGAFRPAFDMALLPRLTADIYRTEDEMAR